jgi:hypothetical protein
MDINHVIAQVAVHERQQLFATKDWQRRAVLGAALRRTRRARPQRPRRLWMWRPLVARPEGGVQ